MKKFILDLYENHIKLKIFLCAAVAVLYMALTVYGGGNLFQARHDGGAVEKTLSSGGALLITFRHFMYIFTPKESLFSIIRTKR